MFEKKTTTKEAPAKILQRMTGVVVSDKMKDTVVVEVKRYEKHPKYGKFMERSKRFKAHDAGNTRHIGDTVTIETCAPISKEKRFKVVA